MHAITVSLIYLDYLTLHVHISEHAISLNEAATLNKLMGGVRTVT